MNIHRHLCEHGTFESCAGGRGQPRFMTPEEDEQILDVVHDIPEISTQLLARQVAIPFWNVWRVMQNLQCVQTSPDYPAQVVFCQWFLE